MRSILVLKIFLVFLIAFSKCENLKRRKRFLSSLWPAAKPKNEKREVVYLHLPPEYIEIMHKELQTRSDVSQNEAINVNVDPVRFVKPTKMMAIVNGQNVANQPSIVMRPILPRPENFNQEHFLPDIHKTQEFSTPAPVSIVTENPAVPLYNEQQSLPIKRVAEGLSVKTASISDFYHTKEFQELLNEFNLQIDIKQLPNIRDVMILLGTEDAEETLRVIREVADTQEGMDLILSYLKGNDQEENEDRYYNIYDDIGAGEIPVGDYSQNYINQFGNEILQSDDASQYNYSPVENPITATPAPLSWWQKPLSWFGFYSDAKSVRAEGIKSDTGVLEKVISDPGGLGPVEYVRNFLNPFGHRKENEIKEPFKIDGTEESRLVSSEIYESPSTLPTIQMSEEDFEKMVKELRLTPINPPATTTTTLAPLVVETTPQAETLESQPVTEKDTMNLAEVFEMLQLPIHDAETFEMTIPDPQIPQKVTKPSEEKENAKRSYGSVSGPVRHSPIESRTGKVFRVNPDEVLKESMSLATEFQGKKN